MSDPKVTKALDALYNDRTAEFEDMITGSLMDRVMNAVAVEKVRVGSSLFDEPDESEGETD